MERQLAVALRYKENDAAPRVVAKGMGQLAERIERIAEEHDIPIKRQADVARILSKLDAEDPVPPELFSIVAEILAFVYLIDTKLSNST